MTELLQLLPAELVERLQGEGRARNVYALLRDGRSPFEVGALGPNARARLAAACRMSAMGVQAVHRAQDGTLKLLLGLEDGRAVESVVIPEGRTGRRSTLCVSSQVGCGRGCIFCATATMKLARSLTAAEISAQVVFAIQVAKSHALPPLRNIVFMGMGEPLDNLAAVERALHLITGSGLGLGFGPGHVTISTVGPSPEAIQQARALPGRFAWSLHAADDRTRKRLVPTQKAPVEALKDAFAEVTKARGEPLFVELTLIDGVNDSEKSAESVVRLFDGFPSELRFNLLPMNPIAGAEALRAAPPHRMERFAAALKGAGYFTMVRRARGGDERAACGQLAVLHMKPTPSIS